MRPALLALVLSLAAGCPAPPPPELPPEEATVRADPDGDWIARPETLFVDDAPCFDWIELDPDGVTIGSGCSSAEAGLEPGRVLIGAADGGFVRRVEEVGEVWDGQVRVETTPGWVGDAFSRLRIHEELPLEAGRDIELVQIEILAGLASAEVTALPNVSLTFDYEWDEEEDILLPSTVVFGAAGSLTLIASAELGFDAGGEWSGTEPMGSVELATPVMVGPVPFTVGAELAAEAFWEVTTTGAVQYQTWASLSGSIGFSLTYDHGAFYGTFDPALGGNAQAPVLVMQSGYVQAKVGVELTATLEAEAGGLDVFGISGPALFLRPYLDACGHFDLDTFEASADIDGVLEAGGQLQLGVAGFTLIGPYEYVFPGLPWHTDIWP